VLDHVSLADVAAGELPAEIGTLVRDQAAWR
jgi:hypothetical protein